MTFRATASILLAASLGALATACASNARPIAPVAPSRSCNFTGEVRGSLTFWRFADTTAIRGTAGEALDTAAAVLRREGYTVARRAPGTTVVTWAAPVGLRWPLAVRVQGAGAQQVAFCALWGGRNAGLLADQPGFSPEPARVEARALYARIRDAVLAGR
jgi:hypothetical protein